MKRALRLGLRTFPFLFIWLAQKWVPILGFAFTLQEKGVVSALFAYWTLSIALGLKWLQPDDSFFVKDPDAKALLEAYRRRFGNDALAWIVRQVVRKHCVLYKFPKLRELFSSYVWLDRTLCHEALHFVYPELSCAQAMAIDAELRAHLAATGVVQSKVEA